MGYVAISIKDLVENRINKDVFLPAIQREYVWRKDQIEKLFDSVMCEYPVSTFMLWRILRDNKKDWDAYEFIRVYEASNPHNTSVNLNNVNDTIYFVLDGQQRMTSFYVGLKGSYKQKNRKEEEYLFLNLLKSPETKTNDDDELKYEFKFRKHNEKSKNGEYWYKVSEILKYGNSYDVKLALKDVLSNFSEDQKATAERIIEYLYGAINHQNLYYCELTKENDDEVSEIFVRTNTGGTKLEYSDILLSKATTVWWNDDSQRVNARDEINKFTTKLEKMSDFKLGKDFVLKAAMYLTEGLPIKYKVSSFTDDNLRKIKGNWNNIKKSLEATIRLVMKFGFTDKHLSSKNVLLPITLYLNTKKSVNVYVESSEIEDCNDKNNIQKWLICSLLQNAFSGSSDATLTKAQNVLKNNKNMNKFPYEELLKELNIEPFSKNKIEDLLKQEKGSRQSFLILSLLYPNRNWRMNEYHEDHIFNDAEFREEKLEKRGYDKEKIKEYISYYNTVVNLELLTASENESKNAMPFEKYIENRYENFSDSHCIPPLDNELTSYDFDHFLEFIEKRKELLIAKLTKALN